MTLCLLPAVASLHADVHPVWMIGVDEDPYASGYQPQDEFSQENYINDPPPGAVTRLPGDPLYDAGNNPDRDDDFYCAGTYPPGFNGLSAILSVPNDEPSSAFERALTNGDRTNRVHFFLTTAEASSTSRLRLDFELVWGGSWLGAPLNANGEGFAEHDIEVHFRGSGPAVLLYQGTITRDTRITLSFAASSVQATAGPNTVEFVRTGPTAANTAYWVQFDHARLEADPNALLDADSDGLPRWWEEDHLLSDTNALDAVLDLDADGLTALQEFNGGTDSTDPRNPDTDRDGLADDDELAAGSSPLKPDSDGDTLTDAEEVNGPPTSSPLLVDTDADGAPDSLERRVGTDPSSDQSTPTEFSGAIGLHFVSLADVDGPLAIHETTGVVPQTHWNNTLPMRTWSRASGSTADFVSPADGQLVRSDGTVVPGMTVNWTSQENASSLNKGSSDRKLMNGFLRAYQSTPVALVLSNVPYANYDLYVHVGGSYDGQRGSIRLNSDPATERLFRTITTAPQSDFVELRPGLTNFQRGNFVRYTNLTSSTAAVTVTNLEGWAVGIHAVQIVDVAVDSDASGLPDWWELKYALQPGSSGLAMTDSDGDGLVNSNEFVRGSNPRLADTDGDGLTDAAETAGNALTADSDGDGLSDAAEVNAFIPSDPNLADTDGDGLDDREEQAVGTDPTVATVSNPNAADWLPGFSASPDRWEWVFTDVQLVWDHTTGTLAPNIWNEDRLISFGVRNTAAPADWRSLGMELRYYNGAVTYLFHSTHTGAFSAQGNPPGDIWQSEYGASPPDLKAALGFSGYGRADVSDRLEFKFTAARVSGNSWQVEFTIRNLTRNQVVQSRSYPSGCTAEASVNAGTASWNTGDPDLILHQGVALLISPTPLEDLPAFATTKDSDDDGMPDLWEAANGFNPNLAADATGDADLDTVLNRDEFLNKTHPHLPDTDGDGIRDDVELANASNPLDAASKPEFAGLTWPAGHDLDGNGFQDAWEIRYRVQHPNPEADSDGDGASDLRESIWGTDPFDPDSAVFLGLEQQTNDILLNWTRLALKHQQLSSSTAPTDWQTVTETPWLNGDTYSLRLTNQLPAVPWEFYQVDTSDTDTDGDGLYDWAEGVFGSDPLLGNSRHESMPVINSTGQVVGAVSGDYAAYVLDLNGGPGGATGLVTRAQAARLLQQASFGPTLDEIERVQQLGIEGWIDDQIQTQPATMHRDYVDSIYADFYGPQIDLTYSHSDMDEFIFGNNVLTPFARAAIGGPDQLRQRMAFALSQILVVSRRDANLENRALGVADYYDIFVRRAFGNYYDVLREVTFHPTMGRYLSHVGNQKARPEINQYPDENYAREVQQLFSIGLWKLNMDGTRVTDGFGEPIPTYGNKEITEFARVFTGLWFGGQSWGGGGWSDDDYTVPMQMWAEKHDFDAKTLLNGALIPSRAPTVENAIRDIDDALRNLFNHPNTAPFISRQLIQFLVTSNPSTNYVRRVAEVFADNGSGVRGDLGAVAKALLLDEEARDARWFQGAPEFGRLKDPVHRAMAIARLGRLDRHPDLLWWGFGEFNTEAAQEPTYSPSVFNFYRPDYQPPGLLTENGLVGPTFQIMNSYSSISFPNKLWEITEEGLRRYSDYHFPPDYTDLMQHAWDTGTLVDLVNLLECGGGMSAETRANIVNAVDQVPSYDALMRTRMALYLAATCPEGAVQR